MSKHTILTISPKYQELYKEIKKGISTLTPAKKMIPLYLARQDYDDKGEPRDRYDHYFFVHWAHAIDEIGTERELEKKKFQHNIGLEKALENEDITSKMWSKVARSGIADKHKDTIFHCVAKHKKFKNLDIALRDYINFAEIEEKANLYGTKNHKKLVKELLDNFDLKNPNKQAKINNSSNNNNKEERDQPFENSFQLKLKEELLDGSHPRLQPIEDEIIGRNDEIEKVVAFLNSADNCAYVAECAGIGKTELCKAALKVWLDSENTIRAFWVQVNDNSGSLLNHLGKSIGLTDDARAKMSNFSQLQSKLPEALYYLDNVESVLHLPDGRHLLRELLNTPGIRVLASSRIDLDGVLGKKLPIGRLNIEDGCMLFLNCWLGDGTPNTEKLRTFIDKELGGHPLSIILLARAGKGHSFGSIQSKWNKHGTLLAKLGNSSDRIDSLEKSLSLTKNMVATTSGALDLWQFIALFPNGCDEDILNLWEAVSDQFQARMVLAEHHIFTINNHNISMLPPIARYALDSAVINDLSKHNFNWKNARDHAYRYFIELSKDAFKSTSNETIIKSRTKSSKQLCAIEHLIRIDNASGIPNKRLIFILHNQLYNVYQVNRTAGYATLELTQQLFSDSLSNFMLGHLKATYGAMEQARDHFIQSLELCKQEGNLKRFSNTLHAIGDLEATLGDIEQSRDYYKQAFKLYHQEQDQWGLASVLRSFGDLDKATGNNQQARDYYVQALELFQHKNERGRADTLCALGGLEESTGDIEQAHNHYNQALELFKQEQSPPGIAKTLFALGELERQSNNFMLARGYYNKALNLYQKEQEHLKIADIFFAVGCLEDDLGHVRQAQDYYNQALELYKQEQQKNGVYCTLLALKKLKHKNGRVE